jgi:hypothetical protein
MDWPSFWIWLSDLTWSFQNNVTSWLWMDWWANLWLCMLRGNFGRFRSSEGLKAKHSEIHGRRRDGIFSPRGRVWTFQHLVWSTAQDFSDLAKAHLFAPAESDPKKVIRLTLCGSLLLIEPKKKAIRSCCAARDGTGVFLFRSEPIAGRRLVEKPRPFIPDLWCRNFRAAEFISIRAAH